PSGRPSPPRGRRSTCRGSPSPRRAARPGGSARFAEWPHAFLVGRRRPEDLRRREVESVGEAGGRERCYDLFHLADPAPALGGGRPRGTVRLLLQVRQREPPFLE